MNTPHTWPELVAGIVSACVVGLLTLLGTVITNRTSARSTREGQKAQSELNWRQQLQGEIDRLKERIDRIEQEGVQKSRHLGILGDFLDEVSLFHLYKKGTEEFPLAPEEVAQYYDRGRWLQIKARHDRNIPKDASVYEDK